MADYIVRIVLHGATASHYEMLHKNMVTAGARRTVTGSDGIVYDLPDGNYVMSNTRNASDVRDAVLQIAKSAKSPPDPSVLVASYDQLSWWLYPVPGQS